MTSEQAESYTALVALLASENGVTLRPSETETLRRAADSLFFADEDSTSVREEAQAIFDALAESGRWSEERAASIASQLDGCGRVPVTA